MATNRNQLESDSLLPPRKRLLAGFNKHNSNQSPNPPFSSSSSSSSSTTTTFSNGSSSASTDVQTHLNSLLTSQLKNDQSPSPQELAQASKANAVLAVKVAKAARATANEKAIVASKAVASAKKALELFASLPVGCRERSPRKKKHVPVQLLYSKGGLADEDLARRLNLAINNSPRVLTDCSGHSNKKQKSVVTVTSTMHDGNDDVAGMVHSDSSIDEELDRTSDKALKEKTWQESSSLGKRRGRVKLMKLPLSMSTSKHQENGIVLAEKYVSVNKPEEGSDGGVAAQVIAGPSWKCQDLKSPECVKENKVVRS